MAQSLLHRVKSESSIGALSPPYHVSGTYIYVYSPVCERRETDVGFFNNSCGSFDELRDDSFYTSFCVLIHIQTFVIFSNNQLWVNKGFNYVVNAFSSPKVPW